MSAVNILVQSDAVHLLADAAVYDDNARFRFWASKIQALPHLGCAIACRGAALAPAVTANILSAASNYADLKGRFCELLRDAAGTVAHLSKIPAASQIQVAVVGWQGDRPDAFVAQTWDHDGVPAYTLVPITEVALWPATPEIQHALWDIAAGRGVDQLDAEIDGLAILEAQRRVKVTRPDGRLAHVVGGFAQLATVRRDSITTKVLRHWNDVPGELIQPEAA